MTPGSAGPSRETRSSLRPSRVVLVTGGGTGIGAAVAAALLAAGDEVAILGRRAGPLAAVAASTGAFDVVCDVSDAGQVSGAVATVTERFGRLDGLVLNAGAMVPGGVGELSVEDWNTLVAVNLTGAFLMARCALPHLLRARGAVVSVASVAALRASAEMGGYAATKAGLVMLTQSLAVDHGHEGLRANVVCPGWTVTEMADEEMAEFGGPRGLGVAEGYALVTSLVPQRRPATAAEVAAAVAWLLSDAASYVNGAVIPVDGGGIAVDAGTLPFDPRHADQARAWRSGLIGRAPGGSEYPAGAGVLAPLQHGYSAGGQPEGCPSCLTRSQSRTIPPGTTTACSVPGR